MTPAIVIVAYNRPHALQRLLRSVANAAYPSINIPLVISIDHSGSTEVLKLCEDFSWPYGDKKIIAHTEKQGLKNHIIQCSSLSSTYGAVIVLEDDLVVSPQYYNYALQALEYYSADTNIAGISLYSYAVTENGFVPFYPLADGNSTYFMQLPSSWGQLFTAQQWCAFMDWYYINQDIPEQNPLPLYAKLWGSKSWKKHFMLYMIEKNKYFVFPKHSYSTNFGDPGTNTDRQGLFQVQIVENYSGLNLAPLSQSNAMYDAWFEIDANRLSNIVPTLKEYDYTVDLYGTKESEQIFTPYLLSSKPCTHPIMSFGNLLVDVTQNITTGTLGNFFSLGTIEHFTNTSPAPLNFYINLNPIKELIVDTYIHEKFNAYVNSMEYRDTYPLIAFVVHTGHGIENILKSISLVEHPADRILIHKINNWQQLNELKDDADYYMILNSNDTIDKNIVAEAIAIMKKYPDVNWLTFTQAGSLPLQRWNSKIFALSNNSGSRRKINTAYTLLNRQALNSITLANIDTIADLWNRLFRTQQLYTCANNNIACPHTHYELLETGIWPKVWEYFMLADINYLRSYYKSKQGLPPVIRQTNSGTYFLSDY